MRSRVSFIVANGGFMTSGVRVGEVGRDAAVGGNGVGGGRDGGGGGRSGGTT